MTDRELLEKAAKAAGLTFRDVATQRTGAILGTDWNPLADDGDALRLAVKLNICVDQKSKGIEAWNYGHRVSSGLIEGDPYAATRRAIVRAAAAIGEQG